MTRDTSRLGVVDLPRRLLSYLRPLDLSSADFKSYSRLDAH